MVISMIEKNYASVCREKIDVTLIVALVHSHKRRIHPFSMFFDVADARIVVHRHVMWCR